MDTGTMIVEDDTPEPGATSLCLNWKITWQLHDLGKGLGLRHLTGHVGATER